MNMNVLSNVVGAFWLDTWKRKKNKNKIIKILIKVNKHLLIFCCFISILFQIVNFNERRQYQWTESKIEKPNKSQLSIIVSQHTSSFDFRSREGKAHIHRVLSILSVTLCVCAQSPKS